MPRAPRLKHGGRYAKRGTPAEQLVGLMEFVHMTDEEKRALLEKMRRERDADNS